MNEKKEGGHMHECLGARVLVCGVRGEWNESGVLQ